MKFRKKPVKLILVLSLSAASPGALGYENKDVADLLGWVSDPQANICQGYFAESKNLTENINPLPPAQSLTHISFTGPGVIYKYGQSVISENVLVTQPGREAAADKAIIYRNPGTGQIDYIRLEGHVQVREHGRLVAGPYTTIHFNEHTLEAGPTAYHFYEDPTKIKLPTVHQPYDAWGTADRTFRDARGLLHLTNATYTTCAPTDPIWKISASNIVIDQDEGFGTAYNMMLRFYNWPILYMPLYSFPIDDRRKTGFLTPNFSYESDNGFQLALPYYWNLAPNYDLTLTPKYVETRGLQLNSLFRYLYSPHNEGEIYLSVAPHDSKFNQFKNSTLDNPPTPPPGVNLEPYLVDLNSYSDFRGFLHLSEQGKLDNHWTGHIQLNYVTDDYYLQDFGSAYNEVIANQLLNQADIEYKNEHWNFIALLQGYQTLHIIGQAGTPAVDQYSRLPEFDISSDYPNLWHGVNFSLEAQSVNFAYDSEYAPTTLEMPIGERIHIRPTLSRPMTASIGYITPQVSLDSTTYMAQLPAEDNETRRPDYNASRNLPIIDVDSGLYFDKRIGWQDHSYIATLEPRLFYLYVPYLDQTGYPNFDSQILPFSFPQLFDVNRFTSYDRLENANQLSFGLTSRLLNSQNNVQQLKADFGFGYYIQSPKVCLDDSDCETSTYQYISPTAHMTPLVGQLTYYPWQNWRTLASYAYDSSLGQTNNAQIGIFYNHLLSNFNFRYMYVREQNGDPTDAYGYSNNYNVIATGAAFPLTKHWSTLAYAQYNISKQRPDTYYGGLQYDSCCWTFRVIAARTFQEQQTDSHGDPIDIFKNSYYVQLQLKSLGNIGNSPASLLGSTLSGFKDPFNK